MNNAALSISTQKFFVFFNGHTFLFLEYTPSSEIAGSYGNSISIFFEELLDSSEATIAFYMPTISIIRIPIFPYLHLYLLLSFLIKPS